MAGLGAKVLRPDGPRQTKRGSREGHVWPDRSELWGGTGKEDPSHLGLASRCKGLRFLSFEGSGEHGGTEW